MRPLISGFLLAGTAILAAGAAKAADMGYYGDQGGGYSSPAAAYQDWTGIYLGAHVGYGFGEADDADTDGALGGLQLGANWQSGKFLVGVEADVSATGVGYDGFADSYDINWMGTARGRIGYAFDRFVAYGTGGLAWANAEYDDGDDNESNTHVGWALGAGVEAMLTQKISAKAEYLYTDFGAEDYGAAGEIEPSLHSVKLGVNYHF